jgi:prepilin-type N-terminal cleavage/methylation domain-containing protein
MSIKNYKYKRGFTLLELMIGIVMSTIIAIGVASVYLSMRNSQNSQNSISEIRDNNFIAMDSLEYAIKHASFINYTENADTPIPIIAPFVGNGTPVGRNTDISSDATRVGSSDTLVMRTNGSNENDLMNCAGGIIPANTINSRNIIEQRFTVSNNQLNCSLRIITHDSNGAIIADSGFGADIPVATGIANMQIFYALRTTGNNCLDNSSNNPWVTATALNNGSSVAPWANVCAVNLSILTTSQTKQLDAIAGAGQAFNLNPQAQPNLDVQAMGITLANSNVPNVQNNFIPSTRVINRVITLRNVIKDEV